VTPNHTHCIGVCLGVQSGYVAQGHKNVFEPSAGGITMPFTPIDRVIRVVLRFTRDTREYQNVLHVRKPSAVTLADLIAIADEAVTWWTTTYSNGLVNDVCLLSVTATDMSVQGGQQYTADVSPPTCGTSTAPPLPGNVTGTISWRTGRTGRRYRGRTYAVGFGEPDVGDQDTMSGALTSLLATTAVDWILRALGVGLSPVVASFTYGTAEDILSAVIENVVDSQRRRLPRRGR